MPNEQLWLDILASGEGPKTAPAGVGLLSAVLKRAAAQDLKECRWSRLGVADALSKELGREITVAQLDAITAESKGILWFPAEWLPAWLRVTGSRRMLEILCSECGFRVADDTDCDLAELARAELKREKLGAQAAALRSKLRGKI